jgi:cytochrome c-type biogenesis protein
VTMFDALPHTSLMAAFLAGLLSVGSSCVLPVIPSYLTAVTALSLRPPIGVEASDRLKTMMMNSCLFLGGFSILFIGFGMSTTGLGHILMDHQSWIRKSGAILTILIGLCVMMECVTPAWRMAGTSSVRNQWIRYAGSFLIGATVAAGWTPCVGPILGTMLQYAGTPSTVMDGITLLLFFSGGLGLPLLGLSFILERLFSYPTRRRLYGDVIGALSGLCLVILGGVLYSDWLGYVTGLLDYVGIG